MIAGVAFVCIFFFNISLPLIIAGTIIIALVIRYVNPVLLHGDTNPEDQEPADEEYYINSCSASGGDFQFKQVIWQLFIFLLFWLVPLGMFLVFSPDFPFWEKLILFFIQAAFFTIGGSYTVLPYVAQFAVGKLNWLSKMQMADGFALAETTPGPLIIVVGFVGFMAGYNHFHSSLLMGSIALVTTTFYTFLPCFLYIFVGGPLIEKSHGNNTVGSILKLVTAAVVGVILTGGISFAHFDIISFAWVIISLVLLAKLRLNVIYLIFLSLLAGLVHYFLGVR